MSDRSKHSDKQRFIVAVLYACGERTEREIGAALNLSRGTVSGIINRAGGGKLRHMGKAERQSFLNDAKANRYDDGEIEDRFFIVRDLGNRKV